MIHNHLNPMYTGYLLVDSGWGPAQTLRRTTWGRFCYHDMLICIESSGKGEYTCILQGSWKGRYIDTALPIHETWDVIRMSLEETICEWLQRNWELHYKDPTSTWSLGDKLRKLGFLKWEENIYLGLDPNNRFELGKDTVTYITARGAYQVSRFEAANILHRGDSRVLDDIRALSKKQGTFTPNTLSGEEGYRALLFSRP